MMELGFSFVEELERERESINKAIHPLHLIAARAPRPSFYSYFEEEEDEK